MGLQYDIAGNQIDGARDYQEDAFLITHLTDATGQPSALVIVADGMGGHAAGNVASNMAVQAFNKYVTTNYPTDDVPGLLQGGILKANGSIAETIRETPALQGMGCTMVTVLIERGRLWWASVGDSHLYRLRDKALEKINADHSYGGFLDRLAAAGQPMEPEPGLSRNMLMSAVTGEEITEIDCPETPRTVQAGDRLLICSDGLDTLSDGMIIQHAEWAEKPRDYVDALLQAVAEAAMPRQDNTTVIAIDALATDSPDTVPPATAASSGLAISGDGEVELADELTQPGVEAPRPADNTAAPAPIFDITGNMPDVVTLGDRLRRWLKPLAAAGTIALLVLMAYWLLTRQPATPPDGPPASQAPATPSVQEPAETATVADPDPVPAQPQEQPAEAETPAPVVADPFRDNLDSGGQGPIMQPVAAAAFEMGSNRFREERPPRRVEVPRFAISRYEITVAEYERFARSTGRPIPDSFNLGKTDHPVVNVNWQNAVAYTEWLSRQTGQRYRLPTEAEWEYAASAGRNTDYWWGMDMEPGRAHCFGCETGLAPRQPTRIGSFDANPLGLHDMLGNVAEWVADCWHDNYEGAPTVASQARTGSDGCSQRVVRGGSYNSPPTSLRHARRDRFRANSGYDNIGFRVVREIGG